MPTFKLVVEYDGTRYRGWQEQRNARTVAGELRTAAEGVLQEEVDLGGSGRTDAGVHALGQVAHLRIQRNLPGRPADVLWAINEALPAEIHVRSFEPADARFHARHHARSRSYLYQISTRRTAFAKRFVWWVRDTLDEDAMRRAAAVFVGRHDFAAFCEKPEEQTSTEVVVESVELARDRGLLLLRIEASHFLWKLVRRVVGAVVEGGRGHVESDELAEMLANGGRGLLQTTRRGGFEPARATAPPSGLFLEAVRYPGDPPLKALGERGGIVEVA